MTIFLATTALENFWKRSKKIVFLGHWCLRYSRKKYWRQLDHIVLEDIWHDKKKLDAGRKFVETFYEDALITLSDSLNSLHNCNYSVRYWRILVGPWLDQYTSILYDRYLTIKNALNLYPSLETILLDKKSFVVCRDTLDFVELVKTDLYNLQIYTDIFLFLHREFPTRIVDAPGLKEGSSINNLPKKIVKFLIRGILKLFIKIYPAEKLTLCCSSYFLRVTKLKFFIKSVGNIVPLPDCKTTDIDESDSGVKRNDLCFTYDKSNEFEKLFYDLLLDYIPKLFVENYTSIKNFALSIYPKNAKTVFSANAWYYKEVFKFWAAESAECGSKLFGVQHGGEYGSLNYHVSERHEIAITDRYYTWGWSCSKFSTKVIPMPANKLVGVKPISPSLNLHGILWVATTVPRYLHWIYERRTSEFISYLQDQKEFYRCLNSSIASKIRLRPHREDLGWDIIERTKEFAQNIIIESWQNRFLTSLKHCRLYFCDYMSTTFLEALALNKPTILLWTFDVTECNSTMRKFCDLLHAVGILYYTPREAANAVNKIYDNVVDWWNDSKLQQARREFCDYYARTENNAVNIWLRELNG